MKSPRRHAAALVLAACALACGKEPAPPPAPPQAVPAPPPAKTTVRNQGPESALPLLRAWAAERASLDDSMTVQIAGGADPGVIAALGTASDLAVTNRPLRLDEVEELKKRTGGREPKEYVAAVDAICLYVHPSNPLASISLAQLRDVFGSKGRAGSWRTLGVKKIPGAKDLKVVRIRQAASTAAHGFGPLVLGDQAQEKEGALEAGSLNDLVALVSATPTAIAYGGCGQAAGAKVLSLSGSRFTPGVAPGPASIAQGTYPLARPVRVIVPGNAQEPAKRYLDWILSDSGQRVVERMGYVRAPVR